MDTKEYKYLGRINSPDELKALSENDIQPLCDEIRDLVVTTVEKNGGHLASNLGAVELSVAIHRVFDSPKDHIIFDVGHQSYTHKLLTGRYESFDTLRQSGGLTGFTNRDESDHDCFGAGHSSTSLSGALGFAQSDKLAGSDAFTVVVLGDGAFTGGMIHEALNNCEKDLKLVIILNENEMSISKNIGGFATSIAKLRRKSGYFKAKRFTVSFIKKIPLIGDFTFRAIRKIKKTVKNILYKSNYFEDMGLYYLGPADGNNYRDVAALLDVAKGAGESVLVHLKTQKGKGYAPAEEDPDKYHGLHPLHKEKTDSTFSSEMGRALCDIAKGDDRVCAITAAMSSGTGLDEFAKEHRERFFDVGIAEEHAVTFAAGLAANGMRPVFAVYSSFLQRSYDQMIHDVALQRLPVVICVDRAGFNESDGATHHGIFDVAFASQIPCLKIYTPATYSALRLSLDTALRENMPSLIRYPSGHESEDIKNAFYSGNNTEIIGVKCDFSPESMPDNIIITHGRIVSEAMKAKQLLAKENIDVGIVLCEYVSPYGMLADDVVRALGGATPKTLVFLEEEIKNGGFGMLLSDKMKDLGALDGVRYRVLASENAFVKRNVGENYIKASGLDCESIAEVIKNL